MMPANRSVAPERGAPVSWRQVARYWGVVAVWMLVISTLSGDPFSATNTSRYLDPILRFLFPAITPAEFALAHATIRKAAHFTEFFVLGSLLYWALRRGRPPRWQARHALVALGLGALYALADEVHQAFVPTRSPSPFDSGIDTLGAAASLLVIYLRHRLRRHDAGE